MASHGARGGCPAHEACRWRGAQQLDGRHVGALARTSTLAFSPQYSLPLAGRRGSARRAALPGNRWRRAFERPKNVALVGVMGPEERGVTAAAVAGVLPDGERAKTFSSSVRDTAPSISR